MSRLGKKEITIPTGVTVTVAGNKHTFKGPKGELSRDFSSDIEIKIEGSSITMKPRSTNPATRALWGTYSSHIRNMITGVTVGFSKKLIVEGTGYKWEITGKEIKLALGFSHPIKLVIPDGLAVKAEKSELTIDGIDKEVVGSFAALVRSHKKPEPYKGKGIRYAGEVIERKQGKRSTA